MLAFTNKISEIQNQGNSENFCEMQKNLLQILLELQIELKIASMEINCKIKVDIVPEKWIEQKGMPLNHDFYVVVGKQCRTENAQTGHQHNIFI